MKWEHMRQDNYLVWIVNTEQCTQSCIQQYKYIDKELKNVGKANYNLSAYYIIIMLLFMKYAVYVCIDFGLLLNV